MAMPAARPTCSRPQQVAWPWVHGEQEDGERHQEQDHRQVIAEGHRIDAKNDRQSRLEGPLPGTRSSASRQHGDQRDMQRINLGDDRLRPERVRERQQESRDRAGEGAAAQQCRHRREQADGEATAHGGEEIQAECGIAGAHGQDERARERVVERVGLARARFRPEHGGLKAAGVAEVHARQQRARVHREGECRRDARDQGGTLERGPTSSPS